MKCKVISIHVTIAAIIAIDVALASVIACTDRPTTDYRAIAFQQNELIIAYEEKTEELATVITTAFPAYQSDYSAIDSLSLILDSLYTTQQ